MMPQVTTIISYGTIPSYFFRRNMHPEHKGPLQPLTKEQLLLQYVKLEPNYRAILLQRYHMFGIENVTFRDQQFEPLALAPIESPAFKTCLTNYETAVAQGKMVGTADIHVTIARAFAPLKNSILLAGVGTKGQIIDQGLAIIPNVADCLAVVAQAATGEHSGAMSVTHWPINGEAYSSDSPGHSLELIRQTIDALKEAERVGEEDTINLFLYGLEYRKNIYLKDMGYSAGKGQIDLTTDIPKDPNKIKQALQDYRINMNWKMMKLGKGNDDLTKTAYTILLPTDQKIEPVVKTSKTE